MIRRDQMPDGAAMLQQAGGDLKKLLPAGGFREVGDIVQQVPMSYRPLFAKACAAGIGHVQQVAAAVAMSILVQEEMQPNSEVTLLPINSNGSAITPGTALTINTVYTLAPYNNAAVSTVQGPYNGTTSWNWVEGQRFFGLVTGTQDVAAGWYFAQGSLKFSLDAIGPINAGDVSFASFREDVVLGREIMGVYMRREIIEQVSFYVGAVLKAVSNAAMTEGVTMQYWDDRCTDAKLASRHFRQRFAIDFFPDLVGDLLQRAGAGQPAEDIVHAMRGQINAAPPPPRFG